MVKKLPKIHLPGIWKSLNLLFILIIFNFSEINKLNGQPFADTLRIQAITIYTKSHIKEDAGKIAVKIDSVAMAKSLTSNMSELIAQNTPIFIKEYGRGAMATASFRGTAPSHTQVLWNGMSLNSPMLGMVDFSTIPVYFTDNITLLYGSGSLSERSGALGGVIKLENKTDWQNKVTLRMISGIGSYGSVDQFLKISGGNKKIHYQTRAFINYSDNNYRFVNKLIANIDPQTGDYLYPTQRNENSPYNNTGFLQELYFHPTERSVFSLRYWYQNNNRSLPRLLTNETAVDVTINRQSEIAHRPLLEWGYYGHKGILNVVTGANIQPSSYQRKTIVSGASDQLVSNAHSKSTTYLLRATYKYSFSDNLSLITSANSESSTINSINSPLNGIELGYNIQRIDDSFSAQLSKSFNEQLAINFLTRTDIIGGKSVPLIPTFGIEYNPKRHKESFIKGSLAKNYHQPTLNDLYYQPGGNPNLKAEEGIIADIGSGFSAKTGKTALNFAFNGYASGINNWIIWLPTPQGYWEPYNMKRVNTQGVEFNGGVSRLIGLTTVIVKVNYAHTESINRDIARNWADESVGKQLPFIPKNSANMVINLTRKKTHLTWIWTYYGKRFTTTSNDKISRFEVLYPYYMNNLYLGKEICFKDKKFDVELKILNLFNESYRTILQNPMPGRNYSLLIRYDF